MRYTRFSLLAVAGLAALSACTLHDGTGEFNDPYEARNRAVHEFNRGVDQAVVRPVAMGYGQVVPGPVRTGIGNFSDNLSLPGKILNSLLQFRPGDAAENTTRLLVNSTLGIGGIFDPATAMGAPEVDTDFGETLHVWGLPEGAYVELPFFGPSTERDTVGLAVDFVLNPLDSVLSGEEQGIARGTGVLARIGDRYTYSGVIDELLYESAESYAQTRMTYLQRRRYDLNRGRAPEYFDPYEDPYADPYSDPGAPDADPLADPYADPYLDPYEDPYVQ